MQVNDIKGSVTHAVVSGHRAMNMGVNASAEFFHILSSSLYQDQILAVCREVLCNGWDAHIDAGRRHIPLKITTSNGKIIIKDSGKGIPPDMIAQIYGTYGGSTKKNDGNQTGGFGLGSKAPFAYAEHFEVTSCYDGKMTIYRMSKSSTEVEGVPSITPVVTDLPTTESGLTVTIDVHSRDLMEFRTKLHRVIVQGDIFAEMDGTRIETIGAENAPEKFLLVRRITSAGLETKINVRYGNVLYPVPAHAELDAMTEAVQVRIDHINGRGYNSDYRLVLLAPGDSISVTPSRESLSMQGKTVKTLKGLLENYLSMTESIQSMETELQHRKKWLDKHSKSSTAIAVANSDIYSTFHIGKETATIKTISDIKGYLAATANNKNRTVVKLSTLKKIRTAILKANAPAEWDRGLFQRLLVAIRRNEVTFEGDYNLSRITIKDPHWHRPSGWGRDSKHIDRTLWAFRNIFVNFKIAVRQSKTLKITRLGLLEQYGYSDWSAIRHYVNVGEILPFLYGNIYLFNNEPQLRDQLGHGIKPEQHGVVYCVNSASQKNIDEAREVFGKMGKLHDYTKDVVKVVQVRKKPQPGWPQLSQMQAESGFLDFTKKNSEQTPRLLQPEFYFRVPPSETGMPMLRGYSRSMSNVIMTDFAELGVVTFNSTHDKQMEKAGIPELQTYLEKFVIEHMRGNDEILNFYRNNLDRRFTTAAGHYSYSFPNVFSSKIIQDALGLDTQLNTANRRLKQLYLGLTTRSGTSEEFNKFIEEMNATDYVPVLANMRTSDNVLLELMDNDAITEAMKKAQDAKLSKIVKYVITALKG